VDTITLNDLKPGDLFGNPPGVWWTQEICRLQGSKTFHWGIFVDPQNRIITESIGKGTAVTRYDIYPQSHVYRIKAAQNITSQDILNAIADYGRSTYNMGENFSTAWNYLLDSWLPLYPWEGPPVPSWFPGWPWNTAVKTAYTFTKPFNTPVNCILYVALITQQLGYQILPEGDLVIEVNMENSPYLEYLGLLELPEENTASLARGTPKNDIERAINHYGITGAEYMAHPDWYPLPERGSRFKI
jgi:hypothetical protein